MLSGRVQLTVMIGPAVAVPVPRFVLDALDSVTVQVGSGGTQSGFELSFTVDRRSPLTTLLLVSGGAIPPVLRVCLVVTVNGSSEVIIDGVMTNHELRTSGANPTLVIRGKDLSALMDWIELDGLPYPAMPPVVRVLAALAKYIPLGVIPETIPSIIEDVPIPIDQIPRQQGTDYAYIKQLAQEVGYVFYLDPGPTPNLSKAYWGPEIRVGAPQPALNLDLDLPDRNVEQLSFTFDKERKELPIVWIQEQFTNVPIPIPIPDISPLDPPLGVLPPIPPKIKFLDETAKLKPWVALMRGLAYAGQHGDSVFGTGTLDVARYGRLLRSRSLVGVRGAGDPFDGLYYVSSVTHNIKRGEYKQSFTLARNGLLSTIPKVPV
jgi:hypothetical protein